MTVSKDKSRVRGQGGDSIGAAYTMDVWDLVEGQVEPGEQRGLRQEVVDGPKEVVQFLDVVVA